MRIDQDRIKKAEQILADNGIDQDEVDTVLQAIGYALLDEELYPDNSERPADIKKAVEYFVDIARRNETYEEIKEELRSLHSSDVITDDEYNYLLEEWDNILIEYNL